MRAPRSCCLGLQRSASGYDAQAAPPRPPGTATQAGMSRGPAVLPLDGTQAGSSAAVLRPAGACTVDGPVVPEACERARSEICFMANFVSS